MRRVLLTTDQSSCFHRHRRRRGRSAAADAGQGACAYVPVGYNWTGFYLGINGGYAWGRSHWTLRRRSIRRHGRRTAGYNWQAWQPVGVRSEGDIDWTNIKALHQHLPDRLQTKNNWLGTVRGRVGYAWDRVMPYVTGGLASATSKPINRFAGVTTPSRLGVGGGVEAALPAIGPRSSNTFTSISARQLRRRSAAPTASVPCRSRAAELPVLTDIEHKAPDTSGLLAHERQYSFSILDHSYGKNTVKMWQLKLSNTHRQAKFY